MKYKIIDNNTFGRSVKDVVLSNRNLTQKDVDDLLNPSKDSIRNCMSIFGMREAVNHFRKVYKRESRVGILVDSDA